MKPKEVESKVQELLKKKEYSIFELVGELIRMGIPPQDIYNWFLEEVVLKGNHD